MPLPSTLELAPKRRFGIADATLAALVIAVVGLMIVPLPTWLLDLLLASNLAISVAILLVSLYVSDALKIAAFPTLLLITTLVRLALNVSSTRLILLQADAGEVIRAFGQFVVRGNYVVGAVIFLILTIIQFVVIAKGSERVAEVGARFTLDAMPGKQLAIDAEMRAGSIDGAEARRRRAQLSRENQFYGAMDGAMKFVKGDVIASFIITCVNILGGLAIGMGMRGLELGGALKRYGLLTIGDGLVTQIPALVIATAAGVLVTRVASEEPDTPLGQELFSQIFGQPQALRVASYFVLVLAIVPGLPALPFFAIGALLFVASRTRARRLQSDAERLENEPIQRRFGPSAAPRFVPAVLPWSLSVSADLAPLVDDELRGARTVRTGLRSVTSGIREQLFRELGLPLPPCKIVVDETLPERHVELAIHEVPALSVRLASDLPDAAVAEQLTSELLPSLRLRAADFLGIAETQTLLDELEQIAPATVRQLVPKPVSVTLLADVLRRLVEEGVSIRDLRAVLEALAQAASTDKDALSLAEHVRSQLRRAITHQLTSGSGELAVVLLDANIEETLRGAIQRTSAGSFLALAPAASRDIVQAVRRALEKIDSRSAAPPIVLSQPDIRRFVKKLIETDLPQVRVVSYADLLPELSIRPLAKATISMRD